MKKLFVLSFVTLFSAALFAQVPDALIYPFNIAQGTNGCPSTPQTICTGGNALLEAFPFGGTPPYTITWSAGGTVAGNAPNVTNAYCLYSSVTANTNISVTIKDGTGQTTIKPYTIQTAASPAGGLPMAQFNPASLSCPYYPVTVQAVNSTNPGNEQLITVLDHTNNKQYFDDGLQCPSNSYVQQVTINPSLPGTYFVGTADKAESCLNYQLFNLAISPAASCFSGGLSGNVGQGSFPASGNVSIASDITISGAVTLNNLNISIAPGVKINVPAGASLTTNGCWLHTTCNCMWYGIVVSGNGIVRTANATVIEDGLDAISTVGGGSPTLNIQRTLFNSNYDCIDIQSPAANLSAKITIDDNLFTSRALNGGAIHNNLALFALIKNNFLAYNAVPYGKQPIKQGSGARKGINVAGYNQTAIKIGNTLYAPPYTASNIFDNLQFGIVGFAANLVVTGNQFQNLNGQITTTADPLIQPGSLPVKGIGIYAHEEDVNNNSITIGQSGGGGNTFFNLLRGIDIFNYLNISITGNRMRTDNQSPAFPQGTAGLAGQYGIQLSYINSGRQPQTFLPNWYVNSNELTYFATGIHVMRYYYNAQSIEISCNQLNGLGNQGAAQYMDKGIFVEDAAGSSTATIPVNGIFVFRNSVIQARLCGIQASNIKKGLLMAENGNATQYSNGLSQIGISVYPGANGSFHPGIELDYCQGAEVKSNINISAYGTAALQNFVQGVYLNNSPAKVSCNAVNRCHLGVSFSGACNPSVFGLNDMSNCYAAFALLNGATIGQQGSATSPTGNNWIFSNTYSTFNQSSSSLQTSSPFYLYNNMVPPANKNVGTQNINCMINGYKYLIFNPNTGCGGLNPTVQTGIIACPLDQFGCAINTGGGGGGGGSGGKIIHDSISIPILLRLLRDTISASLLGPERVWHNRKLLWQRLQDDTLYTADTALQHFYNNYAGTGLAALKRVNGALAVGNYTAAAVANGFTALNNLEQKQQLLNTVKIKMADTTQQLNPADTATLRTIANGCPDLDGQALYEARTLLNIFNGMEMLYTDNCAAGMRKAVTMEEATMEEESSNTKIAVFPNPNNGSFTINYSIDNDSYLYLYDMQGREVYKILLTTDKYNVEISNLNLQNGVYMYNINNEKGRLVIIK